MNQPPNTTEEKSKCCGAEKSSGFISRRSGKYYVGCLKCGEPFTPATPSVCEVAKTEEYSCPLQVGTFGCACSNCHKKLLESLEKNFPTEPKKTVEKCCQLGGFKHTIGLEYKGKVCACICHTPIQTGNDEWEEEFAEYMTQGYSGGRSGLRCDECDCKYSGTSGLNQLCPICKAKNIIQKAVLQERESWLNQKANAHDERIREDERQRITKALRENIRDFIMDLSDDSQSENLLDNKQ